jgi:hypothetical protein
MHGFNPITSRKMSLEEKSAQNIIDGANTTFGLAVLRRSMWARKAEHNAMMREDRTKSVVIKFSPVITLNTLDRQTKLSKNILIEVTNGGRNIRFEA